MSGLVDTAAHHLVELERERRGPIRLNGGAPAPDTREEARDVVEDRPRLVLPIEDYAEVRARLAAAPDPGWLARGVWPADAHGVVGAEDKAGKTWLTVDLAVAKATGGRWLGHWPTEAPGRVLAFLGEGGERKMDRRIQAIARHHGADPELLDHNLRLCHRAPQLTKVDHLAAIEDELVAHPPALVILDPLYLSAGGANGASLYEMGETLGAIQALTQAVGAALVVVTHWNQTGSGKGRGRFTGAGPAEWGRVTISISVTDRRTAMVGTDAGVRSPQSTVKLTAEIVGDEVADQTIGFTRRVFAEDPDDLRSPMHYEVEVDEVDRSEAPRWDGPTECIGALGAWWDTLPPGEELSQTQAVGQFRAHRVATGASTWHASTSRQALEVLVAKGELKVRNGPRNARLYRRPEGTDEMF